MGTVTGVINVLIAVITPVITCRVPPCTLLATGGLLRRMSPRISPAAFSVGISASVGSINLRRNRWNIDDLPPLVCSEFCCFFFFFCCCLIHKNHQNVFLLISRLGFSVLRHPHNLTLVSCR